MGTRRVEIDAPGSASRQRRIHFRLCRIPFVFPRNPVDPEDIRSLRLLSDAIANILERKRAEVAMLESEEKYRLIFESSLNGIFLANPDGTIISANPARKKCWT